MSVIIIAPVKGTRPLFCSIGGWFIFSGNRNFVVRSAISHRHAKCAVPKGGRCKSLYPAPEMLPIKPGVRSALVICARFQAAE